MAMSLGRVRRLATATAFVCGCCGVSRRGGAQFASPPMSGKVLQGASPHFKVEASMVAASFPMGARLGTHLGVAVTVTNVGGHQMMFPDEVYVMVKGKKGDPETTLMQRRMTHTLRPGEQDIRRFGFEPPVEPGYDYTRYYFLEDLYLFREPGEYTVTVEVADWVGPPKAVGVWVVSNTVAFTVTKRQ